LKTFDAVLSDRSRSPAAQFAQADDEGQQKLRIHEKRLRERATKKLRKRERARK
jgi:hypothetical protein